MRVCWAQVRLWAQVAWQHSPAESLGPVFLIAFAMAQFGALALPTRDIVAFTLVIGMMTGYVLVLLRGRQLLRTSLEPAGRFSAIADGVTLRPLERSDAPDVADAIDQTVMRANGWTHDVREAVVALVAAWAGVGRLGSWAIVDTDADTLVGVISLQHTPDAPANPSIGLWLGPAGRGRGLGETALRALLAHMQESGAAPPILGTAIDNGSMRRTAERAGGAVTHRGPHLLADGTVVDSVWYEFGRESTTD